jgi:flagellar protein FliL
MATAAPTAEDLMAPKKKKKGKKLVLLLLALVLLGAGIGAGLFFTGMIGGTKEEAAPAKDLPKLLPKGSKAKTKDGEKSGTSGDAPKYESSYYQIEKEFTSNLKDSAHLIQIGLAVSTPYDEKVIEYLKAHELAVRSAVLMTLNDTDEEQIFTPEGKKDLQNRLVKAINAVLKEKEGFGGVANVYFTNFIVQ